LGETGKGKITLPSLMVADISELVVAFRDDTKAGARGYVIARTPSTLDLSHGASGSLATRGYGTALLG
jgi:hypothetical protein